MDSKRVITLIYPIDTYVTTHLLAIYQLPGTSKYLKAIMITFLQIMFHLCSIQANCSIQWRIMSKSNWIHLPPKKIGVKKIHPKIPIKIHNLKTATEWQQNPWLFGVFFGYDPVIQGLI